MNDVGLTAAPLLPRVCDERDLQGEAQDGGRSRLEEGEVVGALDDLGVQRVEVGELLLAEAVRGLEEAGRVLGDALQMLQPGVRARGLGRRPDLEGERNRGNEADQHARC